MHQRCPQFGQLVQNLPAFARMAQRKQHDQHVRRHSSLQQRLGTRFAEVIQDNLEIHDVAAQQSLLFFVKPKVVHEPQPASPTLFAVMQDDREHRNQSSRFVEQVLVFAQILLPLQHLVAQRLQQFVRFVVTRMFNQKTNSDRFAP